MLKHFYIFFSILVYESIGDSKMIRKFQRLAIISSILIVLFAYLYHVPNSEGVPQLNRIRLLSASMKIISFIVSHID